MEIVNAKTAQAWLRAWNGRPTGAYLAIAIEGLRVSAGLTPDHCPAAKAGYLAAIRILEDARP